MSKTGQASNLNFIYISQQSIGSPGIRFPFTVDVNLHIPDRFGR